MITCIGVKRREIKVKASCTPEVRTYNIISDIMSDSCKPYRVAANAMLWLDEAGFLGELECIYPSTTEQPLCVRAEAVSEKRGFPQLKVSFCDNVSYVQHCGDGFLVWLAQEKAIDAQVQRMEISFLLAGEELVGIWAKRTVIAP